MSERFERYLMTFEQVSGNLARGVEQANADLGIDGAIRRFELCYELSWRLISAYLAEMGIVFKNPYDCFKSAFANDLIGSENIWLAMIKDRCKVADLYTLFEARNIFQRIKGQYVSEFSHIFATLKQKAAEM